MKRFNILISFLSALTLSLCIVVVSMHQIVVKADSDALDIEGIVSQVTLDKGELSAVIYEVNRATGSVIDSNIEQMESVNKQSDDHVDAVPRDWDDYSSQSVTYGFTESEKQFYLRCNDLAQYYMDNSTIDAYWLNTYNLYCINGVKFSDLGLSSQEAFYVAQWFLYENPQYYFLKPTFLITSSAVYIACFDVAVDGDDRALITNEIFDSIDVMVEYARSMGSSDYEVEKCIHDLVCGSLDYNRNDYDQSIYSAMYLGETVCAGYAGTMTCLLNKAGIDTMTGLSDCHAWNEVNIEDEWYGVDATWDDSCNTYIFFDVCDVTLKSYDSSDLEHTIETPWVSWTPELADHDYGSDYHNSGSSSLETPNISIEKVDDTSFRTSWTVVPGATGYEFGLYMDDSYSNPIVVKTITGYSVKIRSLEPGVRYYVSVRAVCDTGNSCIYSDYAFSDYLCPLSGEDDDPAEESYTVDVPTGLAFEYFDDNSFRIMWDPVKDVTRYELELYRDASYSDFLVSGSTTKTIMKVSGVVQDQVVYVRLRTVLDVDDVSYYSDYVSGSYTHIVALSVEESDNMGVAVPQNLHVEDITDTSARAVWDEVPYAKYEISVSRFSDFSSVLAEGVTSKVRMNINGFMPETHYWIRVRAVINGEYSGWTMVDFVTDIDSSFVLDKPYGVKVSSVLQTGASVSWNSVNGADGYVVAISEYVSDAVEPFGSALTFDVKGVSSINCDRLLDNTSYNVFVQAYCEKNGVKYISGWSDPVAFTTKKIIIAMVPDTVNVINITTGSAVIQWNKVDCDGYEILCKQRRDENSNVYTTILNKKVQDNTYSLNGLKAGSDYNVFIRSYIDYDNNCYYSEWTPVYSFSTLAIDVVYLNIPSDIQASDVTTSSAKIRFTGDSRAAGYIFEIARDELFSNILISRTIKNQVVNISGMTGNTAYYVRLKSIGNNSSLYVDSDWASTVIYTKMTDIDKPSDIRSASLSSTSSRLSWTVSGVDPRCEVIIYRDSSRTYILGSIVTVNNSIRISGMQPGNSYYFSLRTIDTIDGKDYYSEWCNVRLIKK